MLLPIEPHAVNDLLVGIQEVLGCGPQARVELRALDIIAAANLASPLERHQDRGSTQETVVVILVAERGTIWRVALAADLEKQAGPA